MLLPVRILAFWEQLTPDRVRSKANNGNTPLHLAVLFGSKIMVQQLGKKQTVIEINNSNYIL